MTTRTREKPLGDQEPKPPFPKQHQQAPGLESRLDPRPRYQADAYKAAGKLEDKVALITGGDSGIGRAVAVLFAREGADVAINYLPEEQSDADETCAAIEAEGRRCVLVPGNLTDGKFCQSLVDKTVHELGKLDILVSNAAHQNRKDTLAELTGGTAVINSNDFTKALKRIDQETSDYYVVGYYSTNPDPTKRRRQIEVKVTRPGANVWHRTSYTLKKPNEPR